MKRQQHLFYKTGVDICNMKSMFNYIHKHTTYSTTRDFCGYFSIANDLTKNDELLDSNPTIDPGLNFKIAIWEFTHPNYKIELINKQLVLKNKNNDGHALPSWLAENNYKEFKNG